VTLARADRQVYHDGAQVYARPIKCEVHCRERIRGEVLATITMTITMITI
jgi:hypothetical protein